MKVIDCYWEMTNLCRSTVEIEVENGDAFIEETFLMLEKKYEYIVVKVPMKMSDFNYGLAKMNFIMTEVQCRLSKEYRDFNFSDSMIKRIIPHISFKKIETKESLEKLLNRITPSMFSTDRISLDPDFGLNISCLRYKNWINFNYENDNSKFLTIQYDSKNVGFSMYKQNEGKVEMILGGIYKEFQSRGIGIITPTRHFLYAKQTGEEIKKVSTSISSNNMPLWKIYNHFNFKVDSLYYVFIKHPKHQH